MSGLWVLFSGTTCEVVGLKSFIGKIDCSKLLLVDILCHGVPSPLLWQKYKKFCEDKMGSYIHPKTMLAYSIAITDYDLVVIIVHINL